MTSLQKAMHSTWWFLELICLQVLGYQAHIAIQNSYLFQLHTGPKPPQNVEEIHMGIISIHMYIDIEIQSLYIHLHRVIPKQKSYCPTFRPNAAWAGEPPWGYEWSHPPAPRRARSSCRCPSPGDAAMPGPRLGKTTTWTTCHKMARKTLAIVST